MTAADPGLPKDVVPPGNQTGEYYIPISNLPFNTTWQGLKDHIKPVCTVDHVVIFPKSTSGWVRVKGYQNFKAVFNHLNGKEYNGRAIIADDRNADKPLKVRDLLVANPPGSTNRSSTSKGKAHDRNADDPLKVRDLPVANPPGSTNRSSTSKGIAHDRNADKPLKVRDLPVANPPGSTNRSSTSKGKAHVAAGPESPQQATCGPVPYQDSTGLASPTSTSGSMYGQSSRSYTMSMSPSSYMTSPDTSCSQVVMPSWNTIPSQPDPRSAYGYGSGSSSGSATQPLYGYPATQDRQQASYDRSAPYAVHPAQPYSEYYQPPTTMSLTSQFTNLEIGTSCLTAGGGGIVYTEQRGIHIRELSRRASEEQVRKMIREAAGREVELINSIDVPLDKDRNLRGWAHVHFHSADMARRMVAVLNGVEFKGRRMQVRLLKEGETVSGVAVPSSSSSSRKHRNGSSKHSDRREEAGRRKEKNRSERSSASWSSPPPSSSKSVPLVVGGSSMAGDAGSSRDKGKCSVVIADGSLGRRRSDSDRRAS
ncbi:hypothetical protein VM1G_00164 [Cytospora mali]|uniref:RRM domain-containing protein n=1 Tax=Cytospora mali TaxID=578113 RepID=A0A194VM32_CYTMA|nr:hypothetical protein VM1G_00164 [Valsa mali]